MTVEVKYASPSQRRHYRVTTPINIDMEGATYSTENWSISGFRLAGYDGKVTINQVIPLRVRIPFQGFDISFITNAKIVRLQDDVIAGEFQGLNEREHEVLKSFITGIVGGEMAEVGGIIRRLDVPVTPAMLQPYKDVTQEESAREAFNRKMISVIYIFAGIALTAFLVLILYVNIFQLRTTTGVVFSPTETLNAPVTTGDVTNISVKENQYVKAGTALMDFNDPKLLHDTEASQLLVNQATANRLHAEEQLASQTKQLAIGAHLSPKSSANTVLQSMQKQLGVQQAGLSRNADLLKSGVISHSIYDLRNLTYQQAAQNVQRQVEDFNNLISAVQATKDLETAAINQLATLKAQRNLLTLKAPADGRVVKLFVSDHSGVQYGKPAVLFERSDTKQVRVYLTQADSMSVAVGDVTKIYLPDYNSHVHMHVAEIDHITATIDPRTGVYTGWDNRALDLSVILILQADTKQDADKLLYVSSGKPAFAVVNIHPVERLINRLLVND